jgi:transposase
MEVEGRTELWIELLPDPSAPMYCDVCGEVCREVHDYSERFVRDLPVFEMDVVLLVHQRRVRCAECGPKRIRIPWLSRYARVTQRLAANVAYLCDVMTIEHVAEYCRLNWKTVKAIHKAHLAERYADAPIPDIEVLIMDEFAVHKGRRYATVIMEPGRKQVLYVCTGRGVEAIAPFFEMLGVERCRDIKAVGMDMLGSYRAAVERYCPNARIVYDLFHVVVKYGKQVVRHVKAAQTKALEARDPLRKAMYGAQWIFMRRPEQLHAPEDRERLDTIINNNKPLMTVYVMLEDLRHLWTFTDESEASIFWKHWRRRAVRSGLDALKRFAHKLDYYIEGILAHATFPLHTGLIEGVNNRIKVIKRMAYGYRDEEYFYLKIRHAFPGNGR